MLTRQSLNGLRRLKLTPELWPCLSLTLMEQQIEDVIAGRLKRRPGSSRSPGFQKIPGQYICPVDQIEPTSHLGRAMNGRSGMIGIPGNGPA